MGRFPRAVFTPLVLAKVFSLLTLLSQTARITSNFCSNHVLDKRHHNVTSMSSFCTGLLSYGIPHPTHTLGAHTSAQNNVGRLEVGPVRLHG